MWSLLFVILSSTVLIAQPKLSNTDIIKLDFKVLAEKKEKLKLKDASLMPAYNQLLKDADKLLNYKPVSVMDKTDFPPSGDKHDYMSLAPYWWPDPSKPNGLPYIRKDGEVNPEVKSFPDKENMPKLCENIYTLSLAYYFSNNEKYSAHASKLLQVWFLDPATKMNPNLQYGQAVKGINDGRAEGIIDTRQFIFAIDGIELIKSSKSWSKQNQNDIKTWFSQFLTWLNTSKIGLDELNAKNNHGVWFDAQALSIALFVDSTNLADQIIARAASRLDKQMNDDGFFPLELARTTSLHYSVFIQNAFNIIGQLSEQTKTNFYTLETNTGKSYQKGFNALLPYLSKEKKWTYNQIKEFKMGDAFPFLLRGNSKVNCSNCMDIIRKNTGNEFSYLLLNLL
jgi:hypothetical protein